MAGEWPTVAFGQVAEKIGSGATPRGGKEAYLASGDFTLIRSQNVLDLAFSREGLAYINEDQASALSNVEVRPGDVLINITGDSVARVCMVDPGILPARVNQHVSILRAKPSAFDQRYLLYALVHPTMKQRLLSLASAGATRNALTKGDLERLQIAQPPLHEQQRIGELLGDLDDKIELNRRIVETLETSARALFKSWFVDFDPVYAKAAGRPTGLPDDLATLFPDSFDAECPRGWTRSPLREQFRVLSGGTPSKSESAYWGGEIPWVTPRAMMSSHVSDAPDRVTSAAIGNGTRIAPTGAIFVMVRGMGLHQGVRVSQAQKDLAFNQDVKALVSRGLDSNFLLYAFLDCAPALHSKVRAAGHGTGVLPTDALDAVNIPVPPPTARERLFMPFKTINERVALSRAESTTLAGLRDTLLPKLTSGELRISDAEAKIAAA